MLKCFDDLMITLEGWVPNSRLMAATLVLPVTSASLELRYRKKDKVQDANPATSHVKQLLKHNILYV